MCQNCKKKPFYITTPIYYPSGNPHIGHCYTTVACDSVARYRRMQGYDVMFLTGTDEHGLKIEQKAAEKGVTPKEYVDEIVETFKKLWSFMNVDYDRYIRTTDDYHIRTVQKIFKELYDKGYIYKGEYSGKYCTPCESFWTESQLVDGKCPECGREVTEAKEEAYFFKMSPFADRIEKLLTETDYLQPKTRATELVNNFIKPGLEDLCVSRTTFKWGIPVTFDDKHVVYVWIDALSNYISALGFYNDTYNDFDKFWPADVHMVAKDIMRFHAIIWPAMLMALDLPLPKHLAVHGWITFNGQKMSKSLGNVVDPFVLGERYGADAIRYHILREMALGADSSFSNEIMINRINSDLANGFGNLVSRTVAMVEKYFGGTLPTERESGEFDDDLISTATALRAIVDDYMDKTQLNNALAEIFRVVSRANKYIDETAASNYFPTASVKLGKDKTVCVEYILDSSMDVVNAEWTLTYDNTKLALDTTRSKDFMPIIPNEVTNIKTGTVKSNFTDISNLADFSGGKIFVKAYFKIIGTGSTTVNLNLNTLSVGYLDSEFSLDYEPVVRGGVVQSNVTSIPGYEKLVIRRNTKIYEDLGITIGDVTGDGEISVNDVTAIQLYLAQGLTFDSNQLKAADTNGDGVISIADVTRIQQFLTGIISEL